MPRVSVGMPVRNGERFIHAALASLRAQTFEDIEIIISDNCSTDATAGICAEAATVDRRIRYYRNDHDAGPQANFNRVLGLAEGDLFTWAADDDLRNPEFLQLMVALLESQPSAVTAFCSFDNIDENEMVLREYSLPSDLQSPEAARRLTSYLEAPEREGKANLIYGLMRRNALVEAGGYRLWGRTDWGADMLVVFKLLTLGVAVFDERRLFHKRLPSDLAPVAPRGREVSAAQRFKAFQEWSGYFAGYRRIIAGANELTPVQKAQLQFRVSKRALPFYAGGVMKLVAGSIGRLRKRP